MPKYCRFLLLIFLFLSPTYYGYAQVVIYDSLTISSVRKNTNNLYTSNEEDGPWVQSFYITADPGGTYRGASGYTERNPHIYPLALDINGNPIQPQDIEMYAVDIILDELAAYYGELEFRSFGGIPCSNSKNPLKKSNNMGTSLFEVPFTLIDGRRSKLHYVKNDIFPFIVNHDVTITINVAGYPDRKGEVNIRIYGDYHYVTQFEMSLSPEHDMRLLDQRQVYIQAQNTNHTNVLFKPEAMMCFALCDSAQKYGSLVDFDGSRHKSLEVMYAEAQTGKVGYIADGPSPKRETQVTIMTHIKDHPDRKGSITTTILPELDHFKVSILPDTIAHSDTATIFVTAMASDSVEYTIPDYTKLEFSLDIPGSTYGTLLDSVTGIHKNTLDDISYQNAKSGCIKFIADGTNPCGFKQFNINVIKENDSNKQGTGTGTLKCKLNFTYYNQGASAWRDSLYDFYKKLDSDGNIKEPEYHYKIHEKGCALCCMAMVLKSAGFNYNPLSLNKAMNDREYWGTNSKGNWTGAVIWNAVNDFGMLHIEQKPIFIGTHKDNWLARKPIKTTSIDKYLLQCHYVIVLVENNNNNHWVLITEKKKDKYMILDPGNINKKALKFYNNIIYRAVIYERKCNEH